MREIMSLTCKWYFSIKCLHPTNQPINQPSNRHQSNLCNGMSIEQKCFAFSSSLLLLLQFSVFIRFFCSLSSYFGSVSPWFMSVKDHIKSWCHWKVFLHLYIVILNEDESSSLLFFKNKPDDIYFNWIFRLCFGVVVKKMSSFRDNFTRKTSIFSIGFSKSNLTLGI